MRVPSGLPAFVGRVVAVLEACLQTWPFVAASRKSYLEVFGDDLRVLAGFETATAVGVVVASMTVVGHTVVWCSMSYHRSEMTVERRIENWVVRRFGKGCTKLKVVVAEKVKAMESSH